MTQPEAPPAVPQFDALAAAATLIGNALSEVQANPNTGLSTRIALGHACAQLASALIANAMVQQQMLAAQGAQQFVLPAGLNGLRGH